MKKFPTRNEFEVLRVVRNHLAPICNKNCDECFINGILEENFEGCPVENLIYMSDKVKENIIEEFYNKLEEKKK